MITKKDFKEIVDLSEALKNDRALQLPLWRDISKVVGIQVDPQNSASSSRISQNGQRLDEYVDDPTAAISVNQAGDYLYGIVWGDGNKVFVLEPSEEVLELAGKSELDPYFSWITKRVLKDMNHPNAGLNASLSPFFYDEVAFGTSGVGAFVNEAFKRKVEHNPFFFRHYGVDNMAIDEGKNGLVDTMVLDYRWKVNRIVSTFAMEDGVMDDKKFAQLPKDIQEAFNKKQANSEFNLYHMVMPRYDFDPRLKGKRGTRYVGYWWSECDAKKPFAEEDYETLAIAVARAIKVRGSAWGRASGSMIISTIKATNYMVGKVIEIMEKQASPSLGILNNILFGDSVLDTSSDGLNVLNTAAMEGKGNPIFPLYDVGDPSGIIKFLLPYLNEKISTAFKIDILLDFADQASKTATEMLQRASIRNKSIAGLTKQIKTEAIEPLIHRCVSIEKNLNRIGIDASIFADEANLIRSLGNEEQIIPEAVAQVMKEGKPWYTIRFNNELEKISRTEQLDALLQMINVITALAAINPAILKAIDWYKLLQDFKTALNIQGDFVLSEDAFKEAVAQEAELQAQAMRLQAAQAGAGAMKDAAGAAKLQKEARG